MPGLPPREGGSYAILSPGLVLASEDPVLVQRLAYTYTADLFFGAGGANSYANRLEWHGFFLTSRTTSLSLSASVAQSSYDSASRQTSAATTALTAAFPGTGAFVTASTEEELGVDLSRYWTLRQGTHLAFGAPLASGTGAPTSFAADEHAGAERVWRSDAVGADLRVGYSVMSSVVNPDGTPAGTLHQFINAAVLTWHHDYGRHFTSRAEAGAQSIWQVTRHGRLWTPTGLFLLGYVREEGSLDLSYSHTATLNVLLGQTLLVDEVRLSGALPFGHKARVALATSTGYQRGRLVEVTGELATHVNVLLADVALTWRPLDQLGLSLRYQHVDQRSGAALPPLPISFVSNAVMLTATLEIPRSAEMPTPYRAPRRVDRSDERGGYRDTQDPFRER